MKVYKFDKESNICYNIIIEEDSGEIRVAFVGSKHITEYIAHVVKSEYGFSRLIYGSGSSMPYKDSNGKLCEKYFLIYED